MLFEVTSLFIKKDFFFWLNEENFRVFEDLGIKIYLILIFIP